MAVFTAIGIASVLGVAGTSFIATATARALPKRKVGK
jgi:hypothetical protein